MDVMIEEFISQHWPVICLILSGIVEVSKIKINPWRKLFTFIGDCINGDIKKQLLELKRDFEETKAQDKRWHILSFANSCRNGKRHSKDEWEHLIAELKEYELYTERKKIPNGVFEEDAKYLRNLYQRISLENDFL